VVLYFSHIFEVYMNFWNYKRKRKFKTQAHNAGPHCGPTSGPAQRHSGPVDMARPARSQRSRGGAADLGSSADEVWRGRWREHRGGSSNTRDKVAAAGAHPSGGSMVRCDRGGSTATSEVVEALRGSPVVVRRTCSTGEPRER
jgi:hypothetical protein